MEAMSSKQLAARDKSFRCPLALPVAIACATLLLAACPLAQAKSKYKKALVPMEAKMAPEPAPLEGSARTSVEKAQPGQEQAGAATSADPSFNAQNAKPTVLRAGANQTTLQGGLEKSVPRTPGDVAAYMRKMKAIVTAYDQVATSILMGASGLNTDPASIEAARQQTLKMAAQVRSIVPPEEISISHTALATTMASLSDFLNSPPGSLESLGRAMSLMTEIHGTMERYHQGCRECIAYYKIDPSLDPLGSEDMATAAKVAGEADKFRDLKFGQLMGGGNSNSGGSGGGLLDNAGSLLGGSGGGMDLGALGNMLGGMGGGGGAGAGAGAGAGGMDLGQLQGLLGGMGGGGSGQSPDMGALMKGLQGMMGGGGLGGLGGGSGSGGGGGLGGGDGLGGSDASGGLGGSGMDADSMKQLQQMLGGN